MNYIIKCYCNYVSWLQSPILDIHPHCAFLYPIPITKFSCQIIIFTPCCVDISYFRIDITSFPLDNYTSAAGSHICLSQNDNLACYVRTSLLLFICIDMHLPLDVRKQSYWGKFCTSLPLSPLFTLYLQDPKLEKMRRTHLIKHLSKVVVGFIISVFGFCQILTGGQLLQKSKQYNQNNTVRFLAAPVLPVIYKDLEETEYAI